MKRLVRLLSALAVGAVLASCGGGGGGDAETSSPPGPIAGAATSVTIYEAPASPAVPLATANRATNAFNWTNYQRARIGLAPFARNAALDAAAAAHIAYIAANTSYATEGHYETAGRPGFTGTGPADRAAAAGYSRMATGIGENMSGILSTLGIEATDDLIDAPYHRQSQFAAFAEAGAAASTTASGFYVIDFGGANPSPGPKVNQLVVYPAKGELAAPIDWFAREVPNPLPDLDGQRVGYPVSISSGAQTLVVASFVLTDDKGVAVASRSLTTRTDNGQPLRNYAFIIPLAPLAGATKYTARTTGTVDGNAFDVSWSFTTAPVTALVLTASGPALGAAAGSSVRVTASGGTGRLSVFAGGAFSYTGAYPGQVQFFTSELVAPGVLAIVRNAVPCSGAILNCRASILAVDGSGAQLRLELPVN